MKLKTSVFWQDSRVFDWLVEVLVLVIVFLIPTIFDRRLGIVFSGTKAAWMRLFGLLILAIWSAKILSTGKHVFRRTIMDWPVLTFLLCTTIATLTSIHVYTSLAGFYGRYEGLTSWYLFGLFFFTVTNFIRSFDQLKRIIIAVASAAAMMSIYSIIQRHGIDPYMWGGVITWQRVIGMIGQPNFLAAYMLLAFFMILPLFMAAKEPVKTPWYEQLQIVGYFAGSQVLLLLMIYNLEASDVFVWYLCFGIITLLVLLFAYTYQKLQPIVINILLGAVLVLAYISILYTQSRGGYMGLFTGGTIFVLAAGRRAIFDNWKRLAVLAGCIVFISGLTMLDPQFSPFERFSAEITTKQGDEQAQESAAKLELKGAAGSRGETWKSALRIIADNPVFGVGPEVLKMVFPRYETDLFRFKEAFHVKQDRCHNETFDVTVTKGIIAFFVYGGLLGLFFRTGFEKARQLPPGPSLFAAGLSGSALAFLIQNQFSFGVVAITSLFWIVWAMMMKLGEQPIEDKAGPIDWRELPWLYLAGVAVVFVFLTSAAFHSFFGDISFKSGKTLSEVRNLPAAAASLEQSLKIYPFEGGTVSYLGITYLNMSGFNQQDILGKAMEVLRYGTLIDPYNADNYFILARIFLVGNNQAEARRHAEIAIKIDPYYAEVYQLLGALDEAAGRLAEAAANYEKTFFINPNLVEAMDRLAALNLKRGQPQATAQVYQRALDKYPDFPVVVERVCRIYLEQSRFADAIKLANRLQKMPDQLALGYVLEAKALQKSGQRAKAFDVVQNALMIDPRHQEAGDLYQKLKK